MGDRTKNELSCGLVLPQHQHQHTLLSYTEQDLALANTPTSLSLPMTPGEHASQATAAVAMAKRQRRDATNLKMTRTLAPAAVTVVLVMTLLTMTPMAALAFAPANPPGMVARAGQWRHFAVRTGGGQDGGSSNSAASNFAKSASSTKRQRAKLKTTPRKRDQVPSFFQMPSRAYHIYTEYAKRLWTETNSDARHRIADDKVRNAVTNMQHVVRASYVGDEKSKEALIQAGDELLKGIPERPLLQSHVETSTSKPIVMPTLELAASAAEAAAASTGGDAIAKIVPGSAQVETNRASSLKADPVEEKNDTAESKAVATQKSNDTVAPKKKKKQRSVLFGALMGAVVACWVFSGNYVFTGLFTLMTVLGQLEYYRMVMNAGIYPARRISVIGACSMFLTALFAPNLHQICLPMFGLWAMIWFLTMRRKVATISEIATTFTGMFYLGYAPSFWVRTRLIGLASYEPTRLAPIAAPFLEFINKTFGQRIPVPQGLIYLPITTGAIFIFWSWLCLAFSDVGGYFFGRAFGKTKLGAIAPAAGATSPNKTVEGVLGGCFLSASLGMLGAWVQKWPWWAITGSVHGVALGLLGLIGDLTASMLKRDAGIKDFGDLIPEHGGIMDRVDSFIWTAPYSWLVCAYVLPALKAIAGT